MLDIEENIATVIQGDFTEIIARLQLPNKDAFDLVNVTKIQAFFDKTDGTKLIKQWTPEAAEGLSIVGDQKQNGKIKIVMDSADSILLKIGKQMNFYVILFEGVKEKTVRFERALTVEKR